MTEPKQGNPGTSEKSVSKASELYQKFSLDKWISGLTSLSVVAMMGIAFFRDQETREVEKRKIAEPESGMELDLPSVGEFVSSKLNSAVSPNKSKMGRTPRPLPGPAIISRPRRIKIPPGSIIKATLLSGASNGVVRAKLTEPMSVNGERLIEANWTIVGEGHSTEDRLFVNFGQLVTKEGEVIAISAQAIDEKDQTVGLRGSKVSHYATRFVGGAGLNFLAGMADALQDQDVMMGVAVKKPTMKNALLQGTESAALEESRLHLEKMKSEIPIIEVPVGAPILVMFLGEGGQ